MRRASSAFHALMALLVWLLSATPAWAQTTTVTYTNTTDSTYHEISYSGTPCTSPFKRAFSVTGSCSVVDVNIGVLMSHEDRDDLAMYLVSPAGTRVQLIGGVGMMANNFNALFDDEAASAISAYTYSTAAITGGVPPYESTWRPASPLSAFDRQSGAGTWTLEICDTEGFNSGTFYQADLTITQGPTAWADLSLAATVSNTAPVSGQTITFTLTVANSAQSTQTATGVVINGALPVGVTYLSHSGTGTVSGTGTWTVGSLAPGASASLSVTVRVTATQGAALPIRAQVSASSAFDPDSTPGNSVTGEDDMINDQVIYVSGVRAAGSPPALTCPTGSTAFDWDAQPWTAGATSGSYALAGVGTLAFSITGSSAFLYNATFGGQSPAKQTAITGGFAGGQSSLVELMDFASRSDNVTTTITMTNAARAVQFRIYDVDYYNGQFADRVTVTGSKNGVAVTPVLTNGVANFIIDNSAYGDVLSADEAADGNVVVTFTSAVDTITIQYGNHSYAPAEPGQQAIAISDITLCYPAISLSTTKASSLISDPVNGTTNPKAIPGAIVSYCILITNSSGTTASNLVASDALPARMTYVAGSLLSGTTCANAATAEDDNATGTDETDPFGGSVSGATVTATAPTLGGNAAFALRFRATIN